MRLSLFAAGVLALTLPWTASAQFTGAIGGGGQTPFTVSVDPQYPAPNSQATLSFLSDTIDLANATLAVTVGGKKIYQGSVQPVPVLLGKSGVRTTITATLTSNGTSYNQTVTVQPQDVSLIIEPLSSAPPLYRGKPQIPLDGDVRVVAVANLRNASGRAIDPAAVSYSWIVDDTRIANSSGIGKQAILVASPLQYRSRDVSVVATSQDGSLIGGASLSLIPQEPTLRVYENDPLLGIRFDRALSDSYTIKTESTLYAAPFSFSSSGGAPRLQWFLNGSPAQTGNMITLRPTGSGGGTASLSLVATKGDSYTATTNLSLIFGEVSRTNIFGL